MSLTTTQLQLLKVDMAASEFSGLPQNSDSAFEIAAAYNLAKTPDYWVWRNGIPTKEVKRNINWVEYLSCSVSEKSTFELIISNGIIDAGDANIRQGFQDIFSGPQKVQTRTNLVEMAKRKATRAEALFSTGVGLNTNPGTLSFEGSLGYNDILMAWSS